MKSNVVEFASAQAPRDERRVVAERLVELVGWPESRIHPHERQLVGDILLNLMRTLDRELRLRCAEGLSRLIDAPSALLRYLARDEIEVAAPVLLEALALLDVDQLEVVRTGEPAHWRLLAQRKNLSSAVADAIAGTGDEEAMQHLLLNHSAEIASGTIDVMVAKARSCRRLIPLLMERPEVRPAQGLILFWWADHAGRMRALRRFAVDRTALLTEMSDIFRLAVEEGWDDPFVMHAMGFIERRQRSRVGVPDPRRSLEDATEAALAAGGFDRDSLSNFAALCGLTPATAAQVLADKGGEPIAVLAKATGMKRHATDRLWRALGRSPGEGRTPNPAYARMAITYETLPTAKAQTVLRYWNWSLTTDALARNGGFGKEAGEAAFEATSQRNAALLFSWRP